MDLHTAEISPFRYFLNFMFDFKSIEAFLFDFSDLIFDDFRELLTQAY
jgi:hypothetical protein